MTSKAEAYRAGIEKRLEALEAAVFPQPPPPPRFPGDPGPGKVYCGLKVDEGGNDTTAFEQANLGGEPVGLHRSYYVPGQETALVARCERDLFFGRVPWVSIHTPARWADVPQTWVTEVTAPLQGLEGPVWLTFDHEPWDDRATKGVVADFVGMYRRIYPLTQGSNVALVPVLQSWPFYSWIANPDRGILDWYDPEACDVLGLDGYQQWHVGSPASAWRTPAQILDVAAQLAPLDKPVAVGEWGIRTDPANPGKAAAWMRSYFDLALSMGVAGACYYSSALNSPDGPWTLDGERLQAYVDLYNDPRTAHLT